MIYNKKLELIKGVPNWLELGQSNLDKIQVATGNKFLATISILGIGKSHFLYKKIISVKDLDRKIVVANVADYPLPVTWNIPTKSIIINTSPFGAISLDSKKIGAPNLFALLVYGFVIDRYLTGKAKFSEDDYNLTFLFLLSLVVRLLARKFGLLASKDPVVIAKLKFILGCYVCRAFFDIKDLHHICRISQVSYSSNADEIFNKYDFTSIFQFIKALNDENVFPGISKYYFTSIALKFFGIDFLPALENPIRLYASIADATCPNSTMIRSFIPKYNLAVSNKIMDHIRYGV